MAEPDYFRSNVAGLAGMIDSNGFMFELPKKPKCKGALLKPWSDEQAIMTAVKEAYLEGETEEMQLYKWEKFTYCFIELFKTAIQRMDEWGNCKSEREFWLAIKKSLKWARHGQLHAEAFMATVHLLIEGRRRFLRESLYLPKGSLLSAWVQGWVEVVDSPDHKKQETAKSLDLKQEDPQATSDEEMEDVSTRAPHNDSQKDE
ncbi:hypothetical protein PG993_000969 [Apiospora rasikravindrae]|uniref:Uncharacterized protein n=1 Tax=Apiospora rasikravindrae TaxID=990691 RepID=A0ABR1UA38_9PEZI